MSFVVKKAAFLAVDCVTVKITYIRFFMTGRLLRIYIGKITGEYFSEGMGWPLALIMCGLMMIGIGFLAFWVNQNYLKKASRSQSPIS